MTSPFPGMDPYLEQSWGDVQHNLTSFAQGMLNERLPRDLRARAQERDVLVPRDAEPPTQGFLEIIESGPERRVITVLEVVSPSNKFTGNGRVKYLQKQHDLSEACISLVEIDLLRAGPHVLQLPLDQYPPEYRTPYKVCVARGGKAKAEIYRAPLRERLPTIRVPLRETDADVPLDLQALITQVYRHGRYDDIDYSVPPVPPLEPDDDAWANELLRSAGKRT